MPDAAASLQTFSRVLLDGATDLCTFSLPACGYRLMRATARMEQIFLELHGAETTAMCRLKLLELLLCLRAGEVDPPPGTYLYRDQVEKIRKVWAFLVSRLDRRMTLEETARRFHLSLTALKTGFRHVYGMPVDAYMRQYRMQQAARMLRGSDLSVAEIALRVGYESPSRFAAVFRRYYGQSPAVYRRIHVALGESSE